MIAPNYRPDIDGLRAIAVLTVVGFHAEIAAFAGGFVGVDVFFVISGFLITGIILESIRKDTFSFRGFYTRRMNRIFPALIAVVVATCLAGWAILFPPELESLGKHTIGGAMFVSNFMLWGEAGYFDSSAKPLLHLWSLAVEEQFYLVWPVIVLVSWKRGWNMTAIVSALLVASFATGVWQLNHSAGTAAFYLLGARFWEIGAGALLCIAGAAGRDGRGDTSVSLNARHTLSVIGLIALGAAIIVVDKDSPWPSWLTLLPVVGTLCLLASGSNAFANRWFLSRRALVWIGLISYPLYLWHWPVLVLARLVNEGQLTRPGRIGMVVLSIGLAAATYRLVEAPIRFGARKGRSAVRLLIAMAAVGLVGCLFDYKVLTARLAEPYRQIIVDDWGDLTPAENHFNSAGDAVAAVIKGDSTRVIAVIGDSHAIHYRPRFDELARVNPGQMPTMNFYIYGGCPPISGVDQNGLSYDRSPWSCSNYHQRVMKELMSPIITTVMIAAYWEGYFNEFSMFFVNSKSKTRIQPHSAQSDSVFRLLEKDVAELRKAGKRVYVVLSNPNSPDNNPLTMLPRRLPWLAVKKRSPVVPRLPMEERTRWIDEQLRQIATKTGAVAINPMEFLCDSTACPTSYRGLPMYTDEHHLRPSFVRTRVTFLDVILAR